MKKTNGIHFFKGHMGGNEIVLLLEEELAGKELLEESLRVLDPPHVRGHQAGILSKVGEREIEAKIVDVTFRNFISMCGGLTQVLGKSLMETGLSRLLGLELGESGGKVLLRTEAGPIPLEIEVDGEVTTRTDITSYVKEAQRSGVERIELAGVKCWRAGIFLIVHADDLKETYPRVDLNQLRKKETRKPLKEIQRQFDEAGYVGRKNADYAIYDENPDREGSFGRIIFPHELSNGHIEPACGTGTTAVGLAVAKERGLDGEGVKLGFESGGSEEEIGGPDLTELSLDVEEGEVKRCFFSHEGVELLAAGKLY